MTNRHLQTRQHETGFTLIELSIVLVIIGLIVGGVLVGQDLIRAAEIRATVTQLEKYNTATNTFRGKYNAIPGDIAEASAVAFGLDALTSAATVGGTGAGDGNGLLEAYASGAVAAAGEDTLYWHHLSQAGYTDGQFGGASGNMTLSATNGTASGDPLSSVAAVDTIIPPAKLGRGNSIAVGAASGINYYILGGFTTTNGTTGWNTGNDSLTPTEAYNIDKKTDDGLPSSGTIQAMTVKTVALTSATVLNGAGTNATASTAFPVAQSGTTAGCVLPYANNVSSGYALGTISGTTQGCSLRIRFN